MMNPVNSALSLLLLCGATAFAENGPPRGHRPPPPIVAALDADKDGVISAEEIANASAALAKLDRNGDGRLTPEELRPPRPQGGAEGRPDGPPRGRREGGDRPPRD